MKNTHQNPPEWQKPLKNEFGIHFKDSPDEFNFLIAFIEELLDNQKEQIIKLIKNK